MRRVEERSLSSILRSELLTTLISTDVSGKVNARGLPSPLDKFDAIHMCLASGSAEKKAVFAEIVDEQSDSMNGLRVLKGSTAPMMPSLHQT